MTGDTGILFVSAVDLSENSGAGVATKEVIKAFSKTTRISVICQQPQDELEEELLSRVDEFFYLPADFSGIARHVKLSVDTFPVMRRAIKKTQPEAIIARMHPTMLAPPAFAKLYDIPYYLLARGDTYKRLRFASILTQLFKVNVRVAEEVYVAADKIKKDADTFRTGSQSESKIVSNAVDPDLFSPRERMAARNGLDLGLNEDDFVVGFVGTMRPAHGVKELITSITRLDDTIPVKLLIVGDGSEKETCEELVEELGLEDNVSFTGFVSHDRVPEYISACDVMYGALKMESATPIKCFEYLATERPVIVSDVSELGFVEREALGVVVDEVQPDQIADAIVELHEMDSPERREMGERGREYVVENHTWDAFVEEVLDDVRRVHGTDRNRT